MLYINIDDILKLSQFVDGTLVDFVKYE